MVRFLVLYEQPTNLETFERHYREVHVPLARELPGLRGYRLSQNIQAVRGGEGYHLVAELEWDDMGALHDAVASPQGKATAEDVLTLAALAPGVRSVVYELEDVGPTGAL